MRVTALCALLALTVASSAAAAASAGGGPFIVTVGGGGPDDGPALRVALALPRSLAPLPGGGYLLGAYEGVFSIDGGGALRRVAGDGSVVRYGDDGPALRAGLPGNDGIAVDAAGNIYVADRNERRVRRIDAATGLVTNYAGPGVFGDLRDGIPATEAWLQSPVGLAVDAAGNLYIGDTTTCMVRRVDASDQTIHTVLAKNYWTCGFSGDGSPALDTGLPASDLAFDPNGNLLIAAGAVYRLDRATHRVYVVNRGPGPVGAWKMAVDRGGNIYASSLFESRVRRVDGASGLVTPVAGDGTQGDAGDGGPALLARFNHPRGLALDASGALLVADEGNHRVRRIDLSSGIIDTVAGRNDRGDGERATSVPLFPADVVSDPAGNLYVADAIYNVVRRIDGAGGAITTVAGNGMPDTGGDGGPALAAGMQPRFLALGPAGDLFIGDPRGYRVRRVDAATGVITTVAGNGRAGYSYDGVPATQATFEAIRGIAVDAAGNLYIGDGLAKLPEPPPDESGERVRRVDAQTGIITTAASAGLGVWAIALDGAGDIYISDTMLRPEWVDPGDPGGNRIARYDAITHARTVIAGNGVFGFGGDGGPATSAMVRFPTGMAIDAAGTLFFSDTGNHRVRRVDGVTGIIVTLAGDGTSEFRGDGGPASMASVSNPGGLALDPNGNLLIADTGNSRVRMITEDCLKVPPQLSIEASPLVLWPPNHRLVDVAVTAAPACGDPVVTLASVTSSEPDDAPGGADGTTDGDVQDAQPGMPDFSFRLRAERSGDGGGRVYTATYTATDATGRSATAAITFAVPHDRGGRAEPLEVSLSETPSGTLVMWDPVPGALSYDVVRGGVTHLHASTGAIHLGNIDCVEAASSDTSTLGFEDASRPSPGDVFFYLVQYEDASGLSSFGEESAGLPREPSSAGCR